MHWKWEAVGLIPQNSAVNSTAEMTWHDIDSLGVAPLVEKLNYDFMDWTTLIKYVQTF